MEQLLERLRSGRGPAFGPPQVAIVTGLSPWFILKAIEAGALPARRAGRHYKITVRDAAKFAREMGTTIE